LISFWESFSAKALAASAGSSASDASAKRFVEKDGEPQSFFQPDDAVLHFERVEPNLKQRSGGCDCEQYEPGRVKAGMLNQMHDGDNHRDGKNWRGEEVERRIKTSVIG
jgi:hypothetical protein